MAGGQVAVAVATVIAAAAGLPQPPNTGGEPPIVSATWLSHHARDRGVVIVQVGGSESDFAAGHIPGSQYSPDLARTDRGTMAMQMASLPTGEELRSRLEALGVSDDSHVIVTFPHDNLPMATRAIFVMLYAGHDRVSLLDGGIDAWTRAGLPLTRVVSPATRGHLTVGLQPGMLASRDYVQAALHRAEVRLIDARTPNYFSGPATSGMSAGHIPGAANVPFNSLEDNDGEMLPAVTLAARLQAAGVAPGDTVVAYCHSGFQATVVAFAARITRHPVRMYFGSFHDWSAHQLPTEGGP